MISKISTTVRSYAMYYLHYWGKRTTGEATAEWGGSFACKVEIPACNKQPCNGPCAQTLRPSRVGNL